MSITVRDRDKIEKKLQECYEIAISDKEIDFPNNIYSYLDDIFQNIDTASSGYLNLITCLICTSADNSIDPRYHRKPGNGMPAPDNPNAWFSGRTVSEKIIYPWMDRKGFRTAKSGWQTRTFERPNPYTLEYPENIAFIKEPFLQILDFASKNKSQSRYLISYLLKKEIEYMKNKRLLAKNVSKNAIGNEVLIMDIIAALDKHFKSPNSAQLPVIAIYSLYQFLVKEVESYRNLKLKKLEKHQASDLRTGAVGDIELEDFEGDVIEGVEVKHRIEIDITILLRAKEKILKSKLKRYYILTTHQNCLTIYEDVLDVIRQVYNNHGCQIIINGVLPTIKYYLRMFTDPNVFINNYSVNISNQSNVTTEQLQSWYILQEHLNTQKSLLLSED